MIHEEKIVLCCLADDAVFGGVRSACATLGLEPVRVTPLGALRPKRPASIVLLVYDLEGSEPRVALDLVYQLRSRYPSRPLLAYLKPSRLAAGLVGRLGRVPGVTTWAQLPAPDDAGILRRLLRGLLAQAPDLLIRTLTRVLLRQSPGDPLWRFVDALLARLAQGEPGAPPVAEIIGQAGLKPWALRRACRAAPAPGPERLTEWLTFIYVSALAQWERKSFAGAAAKAGLTEKYLRQLRGSLLPEIRQLRGSRAHYVLARAIVGLGEECGLAREEAAQTMRRIVGGEGEAWRCSGPAG